MSYRNKSKKKSNFTKRQDWLDATRHGYQGVPVESDTIQDRISLQANKGLPHSSFAIQADPYQAALATSEPYPIINAFNRKVQPAYTGEANIDGGNVQQYANSTTSSFLKYFDVFRTKVNVNYRLLPMLPTQTVVGKSLVDEMRKSIAEAVSILKATTFTQMAITSFAVETDLPMGTTSTVNIGTAGNPINAYTNLTDVIYAMSMYYQVYLQNALSVMNWHNSFRMKQGAMIRNAWNREVPNFNSFFGLMNKKAFLSLLESINLSFEGEYIDKDFMEQINILTLMPARRSNSVIDPCLELQVGWNHPTTFKLYVLGSDGKAVSTTPFFDDANMKGTAVIDGAAVEVSFWDACDNLRNLLSMESTTLWARTAYAPASITTSDNSRYNNIKAYFDILTLCFVLFKPLWADYREALDIMSRTGTINWTKGFRPSITRDTDGKMFDTLLVRDVFNFIFAGPDVIHYNDDTKRWRTYSKWNMYYGTPLFDQKSGGSFLSFAFKNYSGLETIEQVEYLPQLFTYSTNGAVCAGVSRDGVEATITYAVTTISTNTVLSRLAPLLSQADETIRVPRVSYDANLTAAHYSALYRTLCHIFGLGCVQHTQGGAFDYALDPDVLAIYQIEVSDITNMAITYARANAPFRGTTSSADLLGFKA